MVTTQDTNPRILGCKHLLLNIGIVENENCGMCNTNSETLLHLFCTCEKVKTLWNDLKLWIENRVRINITWDNKLIILGYLLKDKKAVPFNTLILTTKSYIFWCARKKINPNVMECQSRIKATFNEQKEVARLNNKLDNFLNKWENWLILFNQD